jgi:hypothetical protein
MVKTIVMVLKLMKDKSTITCSARTRKIIESKKRGGETYDELLRKMVMQYDPDSSSLGETK